MVLVWRVQGWNNRHQHQVKSLIIFCLSCASAFGGTFYQTSFPGTENPISESSKWSGGLTPGVSWQNCKTTGGKVQAAVGSGSVNDDDATAICTGLTWGNDQIVTYTVGANPTDGEESEVRLRSAVSASSCTGYEINWQSGTYIQFVAWNGALNSFTMIKDYRTSIPVKHTGDVFYGKISGTTLSAYVNGTLVTTTTDSTFASGKPGFGFFGTTIGQTMTSWAATDGADPEITIQPSGQSTTAGGNATFTVTADGLSTLSYQWKFNGVNVGANSSSYTRTDCAWSDSGGAVTCVVSDSAPGGTATSSSATLTVTGDPVDQTRLPSQGSWIGIVGVSNGIPARATIYTNFTSSATVAQINTGIANCPSNQVVHLAAGTYTLTGANLSVANNGVTVRGDVDANDNPTTILTFDSTHNVLMEAAVDWDYDNPSLFSNIGISSGSTRGSSSVVLASTPTGLNPGTLMFITAPRNAPTIDGGNNFASWFPSTDQLPFESGVKVTGVSGTTVTFWPPINADYISSLNPTSHFRTFPKQLVLSGLENCIVTNTTGFFNCNIVDVKGFDECWVKNCFLYGIGQACNPNAGIEFYVGFGGEVRHCKIHNSAAFGSSQYAIATFQCSKMWVEDNSFDFLPNIWPLQATSDSAFTYNYFTNEVYQSTNFLSQLVFSHGAHNCYNLFEGNWIPTHFNDSTTNGNFSHSRNCTYFREMLPGWDGFGDKSQNAHCISFQVHHDNMTVADCYMGHSGTQTQYEQTTGAVGGVNSVFNDDTTSHATLQRISNWNIIDSGVHSGEGIVSGQAFVNSYIYSSKPDFFGILPWPPNPSSATATLIAQTNTPAGFRFINGFEPTGGGTTPATAAWTGGVGTIGISTR